MRPSSSPHSVGLYVSTFVIIGKIGSIKTTTSPTTSHVTSALRMYVVCVPPAKPENVFDACHTIPAPLSKPYSNASLPAFAVMTISPSTTPQSVACVKFTLVNSGAPGIVNTTGFGICATSQFSPILRMKTLYEPAPKPVNVFVVCQLIPSMLYSVTTAVPAIVPAVAAIVILPSSVSQSEGLTNVANAS